MSPQRPRLAAALAGLPFPAQKRMISAAVERGGDLASLLEDLASLPDFEPLALALRLVGREGGLAEPPLINALRRLLSVLPDHGVQRVLSSLEPSALGAAQTRAIVSCVTEAATALPIDRIAAVCLAARWLRKADPVAAERVMRDAEARCDSCLDPSAAEDTLLVHLRGRKLASLALEPAWRSRTEAFASNVIDVLSAQPKSLSQANAEELLARRVYAEPGHFLFELLQNAEDARAATWEVDLRPDEVLVWHDGEPFDARDVVGVLSIGQTTKRADQIGLFGVGFKAVYEVSERPQIASGPFRFEIADVSIPRRLDAALHGERDSGTLLVLPLRDPGDPTRNADALFAHGVKVPPETLLTLRSLRQWRFMRGDQTHTVRKEARAGDGEVSLVHDESGHVKTFVVESGDLAWDLTKVPVMVAVAIDQIGSPQPVRDGPTVFSHLPTGERSGLRFLVHAGFDVPLDRERLDLRSAKNLVALEHAGRLLLRVVRHIVARSEASADRARVLSELLRVLPLRSELGHPAYARLLDTFVRDAAGEPMLGGAGGELLEPRRSAVLPEASLAASLAGIELDASGRRALASLELRSENVAVEIGALRVGYDGVVAWLSCAAGAVREGTVPDDPRLNRALPTVLDAVGRAGVSVDPLRNVPCLPDAQGRFRMPSRLARAHGAVRAAYGDARPVLAARLNDELTEGLRRVLDLLGIPTLGAQDLAQDLQDDAFAALLLDPDRDEQVLAALEALPSRVLAPLAARALFRDEDGVRRPLQSDDAHSIAWLAPADGSIEPVCRLAGRLNEGPAPDTGARSTPADELHELILSVRARKPRLIAPAIQARFPSLLQRLGARVFGLPELLEAIGRGEVWFSTEQLGALHRWLEDGRAGLSARIIRAIAHTPIFPDRAGRLRPLLGEGRAWIADDADVVGLFDEGPWADEPIASSPLVRSLPVERVGPDAVVRALLGPSGGGDALILKRAYAYLARHGGHVLPELADRLIAAPVWQDAKGDLHALKQLRVAPRDEVLLALYQQWGRFPLIDDEGSGSAGAAVRGLRLDRHLVEPDGARLVSDLCVAPPLADSAQRLPSLIAALRALPSQVSRRTLEPLRHAPIFRSSSGEFLPLATWSEPGEGACRRAVGSLRKVLAHGRRPLLSLDDEQQLAELLDALGVPIASFVDLADALMTDIGMQEPAARDAARRLFAEEATETARAFSLPEPGVAHTALAAVPIWPTTDGRRLPAREILRSTDVERVLGELAAIVGETGSGLALLDDSASQDAERLHGIVFFREPGALLVSTVRERAREGEVLDGQPPLLSTAARVARVLEAVVRYEGDSRAALQLPLVVDAKGRLVRGARWLALPEEISLAEGLSIQSKLADPDWAGQAASIAPDLCPLLPPRRLVAALAERCRDEIPLEENPLLCAPTRRRALYAWLVRRGEEIERDLEAVGTLARACIVPDAAGVLRPPRDLLIDPGPAELELGGGVADEVPDPLRDWLRTVFRLDDERLRALVQRVLDAHGEAVRDRDLRRSCQLVGYLAHTLAQQSRGEDSALAAATQKWNVRKRLRVATTEGDFERPRRTMIPELSTWELVAAFDADPPSRPHEAYDGAEVRALLMALGAQRDLPEVRVTRLLAGDRLLPGRDARVALARYIALRTYGSPPLRNTWHLDRDAWMPDAMGVLRVPSELFWPDAAVRAVIGDRGDLYPDQAIVRTLPEQVARWLRFKQSADVSLIEVAQRWRGDEPIPPSILEWLEEALCSKRVAVDDVRGMLRGKALLIDQDGIQRDAAHLVLDDAGELSGRGWGEWTTGRRMPRLAAALGIPDVPGPREHRRFLEELAEQVQDGGADSGLEQDPGLFDVVLASSLVVAEAGKKTSQTPVVYLDENGIQRLAVLPGASVLLPNRLDLARAAAEQRVPLRVVVMPDEAADRMSEWLLGLGAVPLSSVWEPRATYASDELTSENREEVDVLEGTLEALWRVLPRAFDRRDNAPAHGLLRGPERVRVVTRAVVTGELGPREVQLEQDGAFEEYEGGVGRGALLLTPEALRDPTMIARTLWCDALCGSPSDQARIELLESLLRARTDAAMHAELDARGCPKQQQRGAPAVGVARGQAGSRPPTEVVDGESKGGWLHRLQAWFGGGDEPPKRDRPVALSPRRRSRPLSKSASESTDVNHASWFQVQDAIRPQLDDLRGWLAARDDRPRFGFAFSPPRLRLPWTYAPKLIADQFDSGTQRWAGKVAEPDWSNPAAMGKDLCTMRGRIPAGEVVLPVPLFARVVSVEGAPGARLVLTASGQSMLVAPEAAEITFQIALDRPPPFDEARERTGVSRALLAATVPDDDLPPEVVGFAAELATSDTSLFERSLEVREFIRTHYRYDPSYMGDPALAKWLRRVTDGRANVHIAALHAGRDATHLGRGVCYELNSLACELLRRAGVPAAVATGWTLDRGSVTEPDHLWALALLPTPVGWRWFPVDASTTRDGRPLHARSEKARGPWRVPPSSGRQAPRMDAAWMRREQQSFKRVRKPKRRAPVAELVRAVRHAQRVGKLELEGIDVQERCRQVLSDPELAAALVALLKKGG
jgi:transglutaminase-like putative cysteine protease